MLRKRACPKIDVEGIRHSDTRDLRLVLAESLPELGSGALPACSLGGVGTVWFNAGTRWEENLDNLFSLDRWIR